MSQQALDTRRYVQAVRRHRLLVTILAALGLLGGAGYAVLNPPMYSSTALVALPSSAPSVKSEVLITQSDPVLTAALRHISPSMPLAVLRSDISVKSLTSFIISVSAHGRTPAAAETTANAVADSYIAYVKTNYNIVGRVRAQILEHAANATRSSLAPALLSMGLTGMAIGALLGVLVSLVISRGDRRLVARDDIANSIGIPVLASVPVSHPSDAADWARLLEDYQPGPVPAWQMRIALQQLGMPGHVLGHPLGDDLNGGDEDHLFGGGGNDGGRLSLTVISLASDPGALALGPQLAVFAASIGIPTALVIGPQQDANDTAALRAACAVPPTAAPSRPNLLQVVVSDDGKAAEPPGTVLTVTVAVVDGRTPQIPGPRRATTVVIGVSAAAATAEQLARAAVAADAHGREIAGILVADPEPTDRTSGRIPQPVRVSRSRRPASLRSMVTEIRR